MAQTRPASPPNPAEAYEQTMVRHVFGPLADETLRIVAPSAGDRILDVATGTGIVLRKIAQQIGQPVHLAALDMNTEMIAVGQSLAESEGVHIDWHEGSADQLPYTDESFDWVYCQQGLQFFPDKLAALKEMARVLTHDGRMVASVWQGLERHPYAQALNDIGYTHAGIHMFAGPHSFGDQGALRDLIAEASFRDIQIHSVDLVAQWEDPYTTARNSMAAASAAIPKIQQLSAEEHADLIQGVMDSASSTIESHIVDGKLTRSWHANLVVAKR